MRIISLYIILLKFVQFPIRDVHMNNLEERFYHVLTNFMLLHKNTRLLKEYSDETLTIFSKRPYRKNEELLK